MQSIFLSEFGRSFLLVPKLSLGTYFGKLCFGGSGVGRGQPPFISQVCVPVVRGTSGDRATTKEPTFLLSPPNSP